MNQQEIRQIFKDAGALWQGHFLLSSGRHSSQYLQCARVLAEPKIARKLCVALAQQFKDDKVTVVIGPAIGGIIMAYEMARALDGRALFAERVDGQMCLRRGFSVSSADRVLVAEDVITTGGSVKEVVALIKAQDAEVIGVCCLVDRSQERIDFGAPCLSLLKLALEAFAPANCPLCRLSRPLSKPGSRK